MFELQKGGNEFSSMFTVQVRSILWNGMPEVTLVCERGWMRRTREERVEREESEKGQGRGDERLERREEGGEREEILV